MSYEKWETGKYAREGAQKYGQMCIPGDEDILLNY